MYYLFRTAAGFLLLTLTMAGLAPAKAQDAPTDDAVEHPWTLARQDSGEASWVPLLRLREAEEAYRASPQWWGVYAQYRAQAEASAGDHAAALRFWDEAIGPRRPATELPEGIRARSALDVLADAADTARVVMVNERHHAASDRLLTLRLLPILYERGYRYFAAETFSHADSALNARRYPVEAPGSYVNEPVFGEVVREALRLGYTLVPYEVQPDQGTPEQGRTNQQQRDYSQARNLVERTFRNDPEARVLVHAGFSHILEEASERWYPMALYFREMTGIDPVTVDQTRLSERSEPGYEHPAYRAAVEAGLVTEEPVVLFEQTGTPFSPTRFAVDFQVFVPRTSYTNGRPDWMRLQDRRTPVDLATPVCRDRWCRAEATVPGEPDDAVPLDHAEVAESESVRLFLPPGEPVQVQIYAADGALLETMRVSPPPRPQRSSR